MAGLVPWYFNKYTRKKNKLFYNIWQHLRLVLLINLKNSVRGYSSSLAPLLRTHIVFFCTFTLYFSSSFVSSFFFLFFLDICVVVFFYALIWVPRARALRYGWILARWSRTRFDESPEESLAQLPKSTGAYT